MEGVFVIEQDGSGAFVASFLFNGQKLFASIACASWGAAMDAVETLREHAAYARIEDSGGPE